MKSIIPTHWHAFLDYAMVFTLVGGPWIFMFHESLAAMNVSLWSGAAIAVLSLFTHYEGGLVRIIPMQFHLIMDIVLGLFLIMSPFVFDFGEEGYAFHIVVGLVVLGGGIFTSSIPRKRVPPVAVVDDRPKR